jgi:osmotically-inducible protein OsmY
MHKQLLVALLALAPVAACKSHSEPVKADNTANNDPDRRPTPLTADKAVNNRDDLEMTKDIRKAVVDDGTLSTTAHNVKIVVQDGTVTLVGPVKSETESSRVVAIAGSIAGDKHVVNQLSITN